MMRCKRSLAVSAALVALGVWACGGDVVEANPAPVGGSGSGGSEVGGSGDSEVGGSGGVGGSGVGGSGGSEVGGSGGSEVGGSAGAAGSGPVVRTVIVRDVFENFDVADNLMLDGGFELSGEMATTWSTAYGNHMPFGNGAACRTGVRCGLAEANHPIFGFFVSPKTGAIEISLRAKTNGASCDTMGAAVLDSYSQNQGTLVSLSSSIGPDGWCVLTGTTAALNLATPMLYLEPSQGKAYVDDVVVRPVSSTTALSMAPATPLPPAMQARAKAVREQAVALLQNRPGASRSPRAGAPWTAEFDPWIR